MNVLVTEKLHESGIVKLKEAGFGVKDIEEAYDPYSIDVIIVRSVFKIDKAVIQKFKSLKMVAKAGTGLDNIDMGLCRRYNIKVINAPGFNSVSTAEFCVMQVLNIFKNAFGIYDAVKAKDYRRHLLYGREMSDRSVGVIGYGSVGQNIVSRIAPFVKKIYIYDRHTLDVSPKNKLFFVNQIDVLLSNSDAIILAISLKGNHQFVDQAFLSRVKSDVLLVNIARGKLVDEKTLYAFLKKNNKATYCCDVLEKEPCYTKTPKEQDYEHPLLNLKNVLYTPHLAGMSHDSQEHIATHLADEIIKSNAFVGLKKDSVACVV